MTLRRCAIIYGGQQCKYARRSSPRVDTHRGLPQLLALACWRCRRRLLREARDPLSEISRWAAKEGRPEIVKTTGEEVLEPASTSCRSLVLSKSRNTPCPEPS